MLYHKSMKIAENIFLKDRIDDVIRTNQINTWAADLLSEACNYTDFFDVNKIKQYEKAGKTAQDAMLDMMFEAFNLDRDDQETYDILKEFVHDRIKCLDKKTYENDLYAKTVTSNGSYNGYSIKKISYEPYQTFPYDEINVNDKYQELSNIGFFKEKFSYLALCEGQNVWMSLNPNEIETMKPFIEKAQDEVLVLGLGMGYGPFMMANKPEVKHITIIEKDKNIINLFNKVLFPSFRNKNKITIICDDAISYSANKKKYDYIFADLWHDPDDGLDLFIKLKRINKNIDCWLETSLIALLRRCMVTLIEESLEGLDEKAYKHAKTPTDRVINNFYQKTKNITLRDVNDLDNLLKDETLIDLAI